MLTTALATVAMAASAVEPPKKHNQCKTKACDVRVAHKRSRSKKLRTIAPFRASFLGPVGACESGTTHNLHHGLKAVSPGGQYRGRYQFGMSDWSQTGSRFRDPVDADWLEQAYRAVVWLHKNGRQSWPNC